MGSIPKYVSDDTIVDLYTTDLDNVIYLSFPQESSSNLKINPLGVISFIIALTPVALVVLGKIIHISLIVAHIPQDVGGISLPPLPNLAVDGTVVYKSDSIYLEDTCTQRWRVVKDNETLLERDACNENQFDLLDVISVPGDYIVFLEMLWGKEYAAGSEPVVVHIEDRNLPECALIEEDRPGLVEQAESRPLSYGRTINCDELDLTPNERLNCGPHVYRQVSCLPENGNGCYSSNKDPNAAIYFPNVFTGSGIVDFVAKDNNFDKVAPDVYEQVTETAPGNILLERITYTCYGFRQEIIFTNKFVQDMEKDADYVMLISAENTDQDSQDSIEECVTLPDFSGQSILQAGSDIDKIGFQFIWTQKYIGEENWGLIYDQDPKPGTCESLETIIFLKVNFGKP